jgi:predicted dehydrogenase
VVTRQLASGALFSTFTTETPWSERVEIYGSKGALIVDQLSDPSVRLYRGPYDLTGQPVPGVAFDPGGRKNRSIAKGVGALSTPSVCAKSRRSALVEAGRIMHVVESACGSVSEGGVRISV